MKKSKFKNLKLNKKMVSNFSVGKLKGGFVSALCSDRWYEDEDGYIVCCTFLGCR